MPEMTDRQYREYQTLYRESSELFHPGVPQEDPGFRQEAFRRTLWIQRKLYLEDAAWEEQIPPGLTALNDTWIMDVVWEISEREDCHQYLAAKENEDDWTHPLKTPERMAEIADISGYARIIFTTTANMDWIHPIIKSYWFALSWGPGEREANGGLEISTVMTLGHHLSVFPY